LIFCYTIYGIIYLLFYVFKIKDLEETFLFYFLTTIFAAAGMAVGVFYEAKKIRRIKEIKQVRKELAVLYAEENRDPNKRRTRVPDEIFGFDPSQVIPGFRN
jgi:Flp pilus assembly protein TadB